MPIVALIPEEFFAGRHINLKTTLRIKCARAHLMREIRMSRFDERDVETEHGAANEAPADERAGNR